MDGIQLRWLIKKDGTKVLQWRTIMSMFTSTGWTDVKEEYEDSKNE